tara:strand:+ start:56089 stop:56832 length:744 start_codon:yes stop_codon:yes gene_type:complete
MINRSEIQLIVFDFFGTLVKNEASEWQQTLKNIAVDQNLPVEGMDFWLEFSKHEVNFRKTRTNMIDPGSSPAFRTYREAWRDAFLETFAGMSISGDADAAADYSIERLTDQEPFQDSDETLKALSAHTDVAVLSNADDRFLHGSIQYNQWAFKYIESSESLESYKPDPRIFARFIDKTGIDPAQVIYVGDSIYDDAHGSKLAGMISILVNRDQQTPGRTPPPDTGEILKPDYTIHSLSELPILLDGD